MGENEQKQQMQRGVRDAAQRITRSSSDSAHRLTRPALITMLCAGAFAPVAAAADGAGATTVAGIAVLGGVGTNILSNSISSSIDRLRKRRRDTPLTEHDYQAEFEGGIAEKLSTADATSNQLEGEIASVLREIGAGRELIWTALNSPGATSITLLLELLTQLAIDVEQFNFILRDMGAVATEIEAILNSDSVQDDLDERAAELRWKLDKIAQQISSKSVDGRLGITKVNDFLGRSAPSISMVPHLASGSVLRSALVNGTIELLHLGTQPINHVVSIEGTAGFGKTTLAMQVCHDENVKLAYPGGIFWATVGRDADDAQIAGIVAGLYDVITSDQLTSTDPLVLGAQLGQAFDRLQPSLLVIDDVWAASQLRPFLIGGSHCTRMITTRNIGVAPDGTPTTAVEQMTDAEGSQLLLRGLSDLAAPFSTQLLGASGRWPILLNLINAVLVELVSGGATSAQAADWVLSRLSAGGPTVFDWDVADPSSRDRAVKATLDASLSLLTAVERDSYLDLASTPRGVQVPVSVLRFAWTDHENRQDYVERLRAKLVRLRLVTGCWVEGEPGLYLHDILHGYVRHSLRPDELAAVHHKIIKNARASIEFAVPFYQLDADSKVDADPWWVLLDDPLYLWLYIPWHLAQAQMKDKLERLVLDLRWIATKIIRTGSPVYVEVDLLLTDRNEAIMLRKTLEQSAHVLKFDDGFPTLGATLLSRIEHIQELELVRSSFRRALGAPRVEAKLKLPDLPSKTTRRIFTDHSSRISSVSVTFDGQQIAAGAADGTVRVWSTSADGQRDSMLLQHAKVRISNVAFSPDASLLACSSDDNTVTLWSVSGDSPSIVTRIEAVKSMAVSFSPDGGHLAIGGKDGTVMSYSLESRHLANFLDGGGQAISKAITCVNYSPDGRRVITGSLDHALRIWDDIGRVPKNVILGRHEEPVSGVCFGHDPDVVYSSGWDKFIRVWSVSKNHQIGKIGPFPDGLSGITITQDSNCVLASCWDGGIYKIYLDDSHPYEMLSGHSGAVTAIAGARAAQVFASGGSDSTVRFWHMEDVSLTPRESVVSGVIEARFTGDGSVIALTTDTGEVKLADSTHGGETTLIGKNLYVNPRPRGIDISREGFLLAIADGVFTDVFDILLGEPQKIKGFVGRPGDYDTCVSFSADGSMLARASSTGQISLANLLNNDNGQSLGSHDGKASSVRLSEDGKMAISAGSDGLVKLWNITGRRIEGNLRGHRGPVRTARLSPDNMWAASGGDDGTIRIWAIRSLSLQATVTLSPGNAVSVAFSPDGSRIASVGDAGVLEIWGVPEGRPVCSIRVMKGLRTVEWASVGDLICVAGAGGLYIFRYIAQAEKD